MTPEELVEIELIKQLKYRYIRNLDLNNWDELAATLTDDVQCDYSDGEYSFSDRDDALHFLTTSMGSDRISTTHHVHQPEIDLTSPITATGSWALWDKIVVLDFNLVIQGSAYYSDEYVKVDGQWLISKTGHRRVYEEHLTIDATRVPKKTYWNHDLI